MKISIPYIYSEFFLRLAIGFYMLIFQPPVNFCSDKNIQTIFHSIVVNRLQKGLINSRIRASRPNCQEKKFKCVYVHTFF
jgi:hypothetical protein